MKLIQMVLFLSSFNLFAAESSVLGTWHLDEWWVIDADGVEKEFCEGAKGVLIYEPSGFVSTSINCPEKLGVKSEPGDAYGRKFFYAGTFSVEGNLITKVVSNASAEALIGKTVLRYIESVNAHELILKGPFGKDNSLWIRWTR